MGGGGGGGGVRVPKTDKQKRNLSGGEGGRGGGSGYLKGQFRCNFILTSGKKETRGGGGKLLPPGSATGGM